MIEAMAFTLVLICTAVVVGVAVREYFLRQPERDHIEVMRLRSELDALRAVSNLGDAAWQARVAMHAAARTQAAPPLCRF